jgi:hypothetical protein
VVGERERGMDVETYGRDLQVLGAEYVGALSRRALRTSADVAPAEIEDSAEALAEAAALVRGVPHGMRPRMAEVVTQQVHEVVPHFDTVSRALDGSGVSDALDARGRFALVHLHVDAVPAVDRELLRMAGVTDVESAILQAVESANGAAVSLQDQAVGCLLARARDHLIAPTPLERRPKRWTAVAKLLTGAATAGVNLAGGVALVVGGGPLAAGVTLGGVLASSAAGVGMILEGLGLLRGE